MLKSLFKIFLVISAIVTPITYAWGSTGHITVGKIAQEYVSENTQIHLNHLIPNGDMSSVANWADQVRNIPQWSWSAPLHFINTPSWKCDYIPTRDCYNSQHQYDYCVDGAIQNYTTRLDSSDPYTSIKFLIHFVGDIHQPLHCGFSSDIGGNAIKVFVDGTETNLHSVWDTVLINKRISEDFDNNTQDWINYLIKSSGISVPQNSSIEWGNESVEYACSNAYVHSDGKTLIKSGDNLEDSYYKINIPIIEHRLISAGKRLANTLNSVYKLKMD